VADGLTDWLCEWTDNPEVDGQALEVLVVVYRALQGAGTAANLTLKAIQERTGRNYRFVKKWLKRAEDLGWVAISTEHRENGSKTHRITPTRPDGAVVLNTNAESPPIDPSTNAGDSAIDSSTNAAVDLSTNAAAYTPSITRSKLVGSNKPTSFDDRRVPDPGPREKLDDQDRTDPSEVVSLYLEAAGCEPPPVEGWARHISEHWTREELFSVLEPLHRTGPTYPAVYLASGLENVANGDTWGTPTPPEAPEDDDQKRDDDRSGCDDGGRDDTPRDRALEQIDQMSDARLEALDRAVRERRADDWQTFHPDEGDNTGGDEERRQRATEWPTFRRMLRAQVLEELHNEGREVEEWT